MLQTESILRKILKKEPPQTAGQRGDGLGRGKAGGECYSWAQNWSI